MYLRCSLFIALVAFLGCSDETHERTDTDYNDPASTYTPPENRRADGKSDLVSPNPFIRRVEWTPHGTCDSNQISPMILKFTVEDHDHSIEELMFEGSVTGCNPIDRSPTQIINSNEVLVMCHHVSTHDGMVIVRDPDGHVDSALFTFGPCADGHARFGD